ncbi:DHA2 family efflux MFS transporter permease subunit [Rhodococcus sp. G-MC3]|uniref:DHA2 family efflux MFS transporter permease subunit n=1 Tax=Rhodococcus sp. G-MC3 TaxID=3046209 RepID=UPI0024BB3445|nr:DHA2 family efflux MFS transporter permease subunit [Rhodococcus sp. G-MC3]MDJ0396742.1 DHA2 family efflux MFS transporter permease subunit [Rhodococcus sp. G-MC3]
MCCASIFIVGLDTSIVNIALPSIGTDLDTDLRGLSWAVDAYTLVMASLLISSGAMADRFGRRRIFQLGLLVFAASSVVCAVAPTIEVLTGARAVQGVGASMLSPVALAIVVNLITDPKERAFAIGIWGSVFGLSMAVGPTLGGVLVSEVGWRSIFWLNLPIIASVLLLTRLFVPESRAPQRKKLDVPGQLLLISIIGGAVALLIEGPAVGWTSAAAIVFYVIGTATVAAFIAIELRRRAPLIDPKLFRNKSFSAAAIGAVSIFVALNVTLLLGTLYLQQGRSMSPVAAGLLALPMAVSATVCAPLSGYLVGRTGPRLPLVIASGFTILGGGVFALSNNQTAVGAVMFAYLLIGAGVGFANAPITNTAVSGLPSAQAGLAGGVTSTARQFGAAVGVAVAGSIVAGAPTKELVHASLPGWILVMCCGLVLMLVAQVSTSVRTPRRVIT